MNILSDDGTENTYKGCVFQDPEPPKSKSNLRKGANSLRPSRRVQFAYDALQSGKIREKNHLSGLLFPLILTSVISLLQKMRIVTKKIPWKRKEWLALLPGTCLNVCTI